ncbi:hypothetical protein [Desulfocurvus sp.]|uniref:hypothetical protein n=1 Tax=Desulfocurvus sp. TaxID=2871698 RepID=UPI0025C43D87|nr:hypothetical protein [Desulfocurvus sp.]MCK9239242.1 hypothetical protein [Desulfocurvus sp.]
MIVKSPYAGKEFTLPDEKLPDAARFAMKCPFTGRRMVLERRPEGGYSVSAAPDQGAAPRPPKPGGAPAPVPALPQVEPDNHPPGTPVAFLFPEDSAWLDAAREFFAGRGYGVSTASGELEAVARLRLNRYDVILAGAGQGSARLREEMAAWPGVRRRSVNVVLVGDQGASNDPRLAFLLGANAFFAQGDAPRAGDLLEGALTGYELRYKLMAAARSQVEA